MRAQILSCKCCYCGKEFERKVSKIKNINLTFCDNSCRARYAESHSIEAQGLPEELMADELAFCEKIIPSCAMDVIQRFKLQGRVTFEELEQEARIAIWKHGRTANNGRGAKGSFYYSAIKHKMMDYARQLIQKSDSNYELDEETDLIYYVTPDHLYQMKMTAEYLFNRKQRKGSNAYALLLKHSFENVSISDLAKEAGTTERNITIALSNARKQLQKELERR